MGFWKKSKTVAGHIVDVRVDKWLGMDFLKRSGKEITRAAKNLGKIEQSQEDENFDKAIERLHLDEDALKAREKEFFLLFLFFCVLSLSIFSYSVWVAVRGNLMGFLIGLGLTVFGLAQAFRYHFWLFQVKNRKLGCTFKEWFHSSINENKALARDTKHLLDADEKDKDH